MLMRLTATGIPARTAAILTKHTCASTHTRQFTHAPVHIGKCAHKHTTCTQAHIKRAVSTYHMCQTYHAAAMCMFAHEAAVYLVSQRHQIIARFRVVSMAKCVKRERLNTKTRARCHNSLQDGSTPLHCAAARNCILVVALLIENDANLFAQDQVSGQNARDLILTHGRKGSMSDPPRRPEGQHA